MLVERCELTARDGAAEALLAALRDRAKPLLEGIAGVEAVTFGRGVEDPTKMLLLVTWASMAAHDDFRALPSNGELRAILGEHAAGGLMEHFEMAGG